MYRAIQINQELCAGCGLCVTVCPAGAINLVDHYFEIDGLLCTACEACIEACPNGAIPAIVMTAHNTPVIARAVTESDPVPNRQPHVTVGTMAPSRELNPLAGAALAFLGNEVAPRLVNVLITALERRFEKPIMTVVTPLPDTSTRLTTQSKGKRRQARYHGRRNVERNC